MRRKQLKSLAMYQALSTFLKKASPSIIDQMPQMAQTIILFNANINKITKLETKSGTNLKGYASSKKTAKLQLAENLYILAGQLKSYAIYIEDSILEKKVANSNSGLKKLTDTRTTTTAKRLIKIANQNLVALQPYGVTALSISQTQQLLTDFSNKKTTPRQAITEKSNQVEQLKQIFKNTNQLLTNKMDTLAIIVKNSQPSFYNQYTYIRKPIKATSIPLAARIYVTNPNQEPINKVEITIKGSTKKHKTSPKGAVHIKSLSSGIKTITLTRAGYITQTINFSKTKNLRTDLKIILQPVITSPPIV